MSRLRLLELLAPLLLSAAVCGQAPASAGLTAEQRLAILEEAQNAYDTGLAQIRTEPRAAQASFEAAADRFAQLIGDGAVNGALHYNLANACLQAGQTGRSILHYRVAQRLLPGDPKVDRNLDYARTLRKSRIPDSGRRALAAALLRWHQEIPVRTRFGVFAVSWLLFWALLSAACLAPSPAGRGRLPLQQPWWRWGAVATAAVWLAAGASVAADTMLHRGATEGVVLADEVVVRKGNSEGFEPKFAQMLYEGVEFRVLEERPNWLHIELPDGKTGRIRADQAGLIG